MLSTPILPLLLLLLLTTTTFAHTSKTSSQLILTLCNSTSNPSLCISSLSPFSTVDDPIQLALLSCSNLTLPPVSSAYKKSSSLLKKSPDARTAKALQDCKDLLANAIDLVGISIWQIDQIQYMYGPNGKDWALTNVMNYLRDALTKEATCIDTLKEMGALAKSLRERVVKAENYTSIALGIVVRVNS